MIDTADSIYIQARAQILWGSSRKDVKSWLYDQGCYGSEANKILEICLQERARRVRRIALIKLLSWLFVSMILILFAILATLFPGEGDISTLAPYSLFVVPFLFYQLTGAVITLAKGANTKGTISSIEDPEEPYEKQRWRL